MDTNTTPTPQPAPAPPATPSPQNTFPFVLLVPLLLFFLLGSGMIYYLLSPTTQTTNKNVSVSPSPIIVSSPIPTATTTNPKLAVFMRKGEVFVKDFNTDKERKLSKSSPVDSPKLSYDGSYITYFYIIHAADGFPTSSFYVADTEGKTEHEIGIGNGASRLHWASNGNYLGYITFSDGQQAEIVLYDAERNIQITRQHINTLTGNVLTVDKAYNTDIGCSTIEKKYQEFCTEYAKILQSDLTYPDSTYKRDFYQTSRYTKPNYILTSSEKLKNGLVILEYYTGEPQNPESKWGIGGGVFIPGYDEGVTQTYTLLIDETKQTVIEELPLAVDADFIFTQ